MHTHRLERSSLGPKRFGAQHRIKGQIDNGATGCYVGIVRVIVQHDVMVRGRSHVRPKGDSAEYVLLLNKAP